MYSNAMESISSDYKYGYEYKIDLSRMLFALLR